MSLLSKTHKGQALNRKGAMKGKQLVAARIADCYMLLHHLIVFTRVQGQQIIQTAEQRAGELWEAHLLLNITRLGK